MTWVEVIHALTDLMTSAFGRGWGWAVIYLVFRIVKKNLSFFPLFKGNQTALLTWRTGIGRV